MGSFIPFLGAAGIVFIIGMILDLIAIKGISDDLQEPVVFRNALNGFIFGAVGVAISVVVFRIFSSAVFSRLLLSRPLIEIFSILGALAALFGIFVFLIFSAIFYRRAFKRLAAKTGVGMFRTGSLMLLIGAALIIVFGLGFVLMFVAWILLAVAFFSMRLPTPEETLVSSSSSPTSQPLDSTQTGQVKYCPNCGAENKADATFCGHCGRKLS